ncbi:hypothetical protein AVEN_12576-1 [Araneus ventricosus]|uniref:Uncharacterized protein n=1 Tax=Araneus ventricosus TaxID=182803 RepID=A0A4Y2ACA1_ARAVE|nr:hypothetical protein AVEN_12576-1 [Araneus ventricosus]
MNNRRDLLESENGIIDFQAKWGSICKTAPFENCPRAEVFKSIENGKIACTEFHQQMALCIQSVNHWKTNGNYITMFKKYPLSAATTRLNRSTKLAATFSSLYWNSSNSSQTVCTRSAIVVRFSRYTASFKWSNKKSHGLRSAELTGLRTCLIYSNMMLQCHLSVKFYITKK